MTEPIYLDNNATSRPLPEVVDVVAKHFAEDYGNPGSRHELGRRARRVLEDARETVARIVGADPDEVVFTSGGTEAINLAILGSVGGFGGGTNGRRPGSILRTAGEHPATTETIDHLSTASTESANDSPDSPQRLLEVDADGRLRDDQLAGLPWDDVRLATVILAHNETGVVQNLESLSRTCAEQGVPLHVDAVQAVGKIPVDFHALGATTLALGAHKFNGPRGIGALLVRSDVKLTMASFGGHQEQGRRAGTECVALAAGMARALEMWDANRAEWSSSIEGLRDRFEARLTANCPPVVLNGSREHRLPNTAHVAFPGVDAEALLVALDVAGVCCSIGSTCASGAAQTSPVLGAMGIPEEIATSSLRFSLGVENTEEQIDEAVRRITTAVDRARSATTS